MSETTLLSPSLRVENGDYHGQAVEVMRSLIKFYDSMIKLGPFMKISQTKLDKLEYRAELARDNLIKFLHLVPARNDKQELHILTYKKRLTEHCHLQHTLEVWKSALRNFSSLPQVPAEMLDFPSTYGTQPVTQMIDKILTDCSLPFDLQQLREEMVELGVSQISSKTSREKGQHKIRHHPRHHQRQPVEQPFPIQLKPFSTITRESCRLFFDSLSDKSAILRLENHNKTATKKNSTSIRTEKKDSPVKEPFDSSYMYIYPPDFIPSVALKAFLEEQVPAPKKTYVLPPDIFGKGKKVLPDIRADLQKEMERLAAQKPACHGTPETEAREFDMVTAPVKRSTPRIIIDRYDEYLKIKKTMQGLIGPADSSAAKTALVDKQKVEDPSPKASEISDFVRGISTKLFSGTSSKNESKFNTVIELSDARDFSVPGATQDKKHHAKKQRSKTSVKTVSVVKKRKRKEIETSQEKEGNCQAKNAGKLGPKHSDRAMKQRNEKRVRHKKAVEKDTDNGESASKRVKASPVQLSFLEPAFVQDYKIPKRRVKSVKCLGIPKVGLKRKGLDDGETDRCGKRSRNH